MADTSAPTFADLGVHQKIASILQDEGFDAPFPIQVATVPDTLAGRDVLGRGRTGSGKTLAFAIPVVSRLMGDETRRVPGRPRALILAPTRELASQIYRTVDMIARPLGLRTATVYGGVPTKPQVAAFRKGVDIVVACPGRLEDLLQQQALTLKGVEITVLDEADHMADLGFLPSVKRLLDATPHGSQRLLFSATLDRGIDGIVKQYLQKPVTHSVDSAESPVDTMEHHVLYVNSETRMPVLVDLLSAPGKTIVFTRTKYKAKALARSLNRNGIPSVEMHSNLAQNARIRNLAAFSDGRANTLVATDIAARGIHVDDVSLVIHADPPVEHKAYLHRSGRTARAGSAGTVVTITLPEQRRDVADLVKKAKIAPTFTDAAPGHPILAELAPGERVRLSSAEVEKLLPTAPPQPNSKRSGSRGAARGGDESRPDGAKAARRAGESRARRSSPKPGAAKAGVPKAGASTGKPRSAKAGSGAGSGTKRPGGPARPGGQRGGARRG